jgi:hypothetical protein
MKARQLLIATPLLKWHLEHGLEVTKIYQVIEYTPQRCFHEFVEVVSEDRRQKDTDPQHIGFDDVDQPRSTQSQVSIICIHFKIMDKFIKKIIIELQHV